MVQLLINRKRTSRDRTVLAIFCLLLVCTTTLRLVHGAETPNNGSTNNLEAVGNKPNDDQKVTRNTDVAANADVSAVAKAGGAGSGGGGNAADVGGDTPKANQNNNAGAVSSSDNGDDDDDGRENADDANGGDNVTALSQHSGSSLQCKDGLLLKVWMPIDNVSTGDRVARGLVYFLAMSYLFIGVSIVSDRFMAAIEVITSKEKEVVIKKKGGETQVVVVRVWNETVANLTLMALGSSAPEILLSVIEMFQKGFEAGDLGPGTIVGSAAYNLFVIIALCIAVIPNGQVRKIKHLRVFIVTAAWSLFAYVWLYLILAQISPGRVEVWEGLLTFIFFPTTVLTAYIADRRLLIYKYLDKNYRMNKRGVIVSAEGDAVLEMNRHESIKELAENEEMKDFEDARREYISTLKELRKKYPQSDLEQLEMMAQEQLINRGPKSRAFYRIQATRKMMGSGNIMRKVQERALTDLNEVKAQLQRVEVEAEDDDTTVRICFEPGHYTVMESCGEFELRVVRRGDLSGYTTVDYQTEDGSAEAGSDYIGKKGVLTFPPGVDEQRFKIEVIDDDVFEQDEHFYVRLSNPSDPAILAVPKVATVMILDDDHAGIFAFNQKTHDFAESIGTYDLKVQRYSGARGKVIIPYWTEDGTGKAGKDYEPVQGELVFENNETEKFIPLGIIEEGSYEKDVLFYVNIGEPIIAPDNSIKTEALKFLNKFLDDEMVGLIEAAEKKAPEELTEEDKMALLGRPKLGEVVRAELRIKESKEFKNTVDKLVQRANASLLIGTSSWKEQFADALTVTAGDDDGNGDGGEDDGPQSPSCFDYILHFLTLFWKIIFAFIPPTDIANGYLCFVVSICGIGMVTALIGDVASHFGCTLGVKDAVTAICFVALGTSLPDTFASKVAAIQDKTADASIGNVTGSNAVNVFLGIGVAWTMAAIYHESHGRAFKVEAGTLAFSVTLFLSGAVIAVFLIMYRRKKSIGGELGGPSPQKYIHSAIFFSLWLIYLIMSTLEAYGVIQGF
ncbi:sodium/calcium exchanger 3 isoform X1 [Zeugodacus cucurbitae]|uniref:sodium/calcium exchanger 3 isoform X1 n=1 Tax=Zeugodacus cucurbitae TaxID=28588 RepID=UPI0023D92955|nr:sodium/calcium exchanger 3 isoform X1 [Zeugodacus cucurbitae]XP_054091650.1 sodium/calcium exchanger 3 isoform X1 [Zeugodacus cucurbitae]XP_054091651.1 sodium/calcium exchanger 3 isoform X1 [Zeugodacus cucurbitae]XP_054091653.1 sodium/calcium exchanger 3 isoform X1 [Zeugodacus cucurbitae]XP_054091658.1 sodium/calcium exchanger 3 isoform X1 [Zeugodacus cucurbitae]